MLDLTPQIHAVAQAHPLRTEAQHRTVFAGQTVAQIVGQFDLDPRFGIPHVAVVLGGRSAIVPLSMWGRVRPRAGARVEIFHPVEGPALGAILAAGVSAAAPAIAGSVFGLTAGTFAYALATTAITVVGGLLVNALIPPAQTGGAGGPENYAITGTQNAENRYGVFPSVLGRHRMYPPKTATGYTETIGTDIYWRGRYTFGWGPVALEDLRIGNTPITEFDDVEVEFLNVDQAHTDIAGLGALVTGWRSGAQAMQLYPDAILEDQHNVLLLTDAPTIRRTRTRARSASVDISFSKGLYDSEEGKTGKHEANFSFRWRPVGGSWTSAGTERYRAKSTSLLRFSKTFDFPAEGEYEIEITRTDEIDTDSGDQNEGYLTAVRTIRAGGLPSNPDIAEVAIRIKATEQLNGQVDSLNAIVRQLAPVWDGSAWTAPQPVRHPAWIYARALTGPHLRRPVAPSRLDAAALKSWADQEPYWTCDYVVDSETRLADVLRIVCAAGRAQYALTDLRYSVIRDGGAGPIRQVFSPRNSWGFKGSVEFPRDIHGFRVRVRSERLEWEEDEVEVYLDGYGPGTATEFETLELPGVVLTGDVETQSNAWRLGRYHLAVARLRPERFEFMADFEHLRITRGDKIQLVHDVPKIGVGAARITAIHRTGSTLDAVDLDEDFGLTVASFRLTVRARDGGRHVLTASSPVSGHRWTRTAGAVHPDDIAVGDLVVIEQTAQAVMEGLVTGIYPQGDMAARITLVPAAPAVLTADGGTIPPYDPIVTEPSRRYGPPAPTVYQVYSGRRAAVENRDGSLSPRIAVDLAAGASQGAETLARLRWRRLDADPIWTYGTRAEARGTLFTAILDEGAPYRVEVEAVDAEGKGRGFVLAGEVQARGRDFDYVAPGGWAGYSAIGQVTLAGDPYLQPDFMEFRIYGASAESDALTLVGRSRTPDFVYSGPFVRFRVAAADFSGAESPLTGWIDAVPREIYDQDFAQSVWDRIQSTADDAAADAANGAAQDAAAATAAVAQDLADEIAARAAQAQALADDIADQAAALGVEQSERVAGAVQAADRYRALLSEVNALRDYATNLDYGQYAAREQLRRQISATVEGYAASFDERITSAASATGAVTERVVTLEAASDDLAATIAQVDTARIDGDDALASQLALLSVGTVNQFDHARIWYFDDDAEGWTGSPAGPSVIAPGWLRPGIASTLASPDGLAAPGGRYGQVRMRLRRVGSPAWTGYLWWRDAGQGWDAGRRITVAEPTWTDGLALLTITPDWTGNIDQLRFDPADASDASNYIELDWLAVGRPAPGASSADLVSERQARIAADSAQASDIDALQAALTATDGELTALGSAVDALDVRVGETETGLSAAVDAITALDASLEGKAEASALDALSIEVAEYGLGGLSSLAEATRALRSAQLALASEALDADFAAFLGDRRSAELVAEASQSLGTRIDQTNDSLSIVSESVTRLQAALPGLASANALQVLQSAVTAQGSTITSQGSAITSLDAALTGLTSTVAAKADSSALSSLQADVTAQGDTVTAQGSAITALQSSLGDLTTTVGTKASSSALSSLTDTVTAQGDTISAQGGAITSLNVELSALQGAVNTKADGSALQALDSRVETAETTITSQGSAITSLENNLSDLTGVVAGKASSSALNSLTSRVSSAEGTITSQGSAITSLQNDLGDLAGVVGTKASSAALSSLTSVVDGQGSTIAAQATAITNLQTTVGGHTTSISQTSSTVDGIKAVHALKIDNNGHVSGFGLISEIIDGVPVADFTVSADSFSIGAPGGGAVTPFVVYTSPRVVGGVSYPAGTYIDNAWIGEAKVQKLSIAGKAVDTDRLDDNAVTEVTTAYRATSLESLVYNSENTMITMAASARAGSEMRCEAFFDIQMQPDPNNPNADFDCRIKIRRNGATIRRIDVRRKGDGSTWSTYVNVAGFIEAVGGVNTIDLRAENRSSANQTMTITNMDLTAMELKR